MVPVSLYVAFASLIMSRLYAVSVSYVILSSWEGWEYIMMFVRKAEGTVWHRYRYYHDRSVVDRFRW